MSGKNIKKISPNDFANLAIGVPFLDQGRDFFGWDCWGLVVRAYRECFDIELPGFEEVSALDAKAASQLFTVHRHAWRFVLPPQERPGDVILLRQGRWPCHVGLIVQIGLMLHVDKDCSTVIEPYNSILWKTRLIGIYRHADLAGA